jgi:anaerobic magnesium-protoporphyrin IX monomethyl ester cyclase
LIIKDSVEEYDGTHAVTKSRYLEAEEIEFLRWRAERWLMVRQMSEVLLHNPLFCLRYAHEVLRHMYREAPEIIARTRK